MPPIVLVFTVTGCALFVISSFFLGWGAKADDSGSNPLKTVGAIAIAAGVVDLISAVYIVTQRTSADLGAAGGGGGSVPVLLGGLVGFYGLFFTSVGTAAFLGLDLRPIANLAIPVGIVPLFWWNFAPFQGGWLFRSILVVWVIAFLAVAATVYGKLGAKALGGILLLTALYTFFLPVVFLATGTAIP
jgi:hypothetical protein